MWFWRRLFFTFSVLTVSFGLGLDLDSNLFGLGLDLDSNLFGLGLDSDSNLFGLGLVLDLTKVDLTTALIPSMLNGWHVWWVCWPCKNWEVFSFQEFCTDPCNMGPCIIMLQHKVMVVDEWHNNWPQYLVTVSLCIQKMPSKNAPV